MTVVAFVNDVADAQPVVTWAGKFAAAADAELVVFYASNLSTEAAPPLDVVGDDEFQDVIHEAISDAVEGIVRKQRARKGRIARHDVSIRRVLDPDPVAGIISRLRVESPSLFVGANFDPAGDETSKTVAQQVAMKASCDSIILWGAQEIKPKAKGILVATSDGSHDKSAVAFAAQAAKVTTDGTKVICVEASVGEEAIQVGERHLRALFRELSIEESSKLKVQSVLGDDWDQAIVEQRGDCDLLIVGADMEKSVSSLRDKAPKAIVGVFRRAPRFTLRRQGKRTTWLLPQIHATDYADLYEKLQAGSRWNSDFVVMISLAAAIATLGLLQSSPAVVIGSMLLAPLMTPMIGLGLALNQGNSKLAYACFRAIGRGFIAALGISVILGLVTPGSELTPEIVSRTEPNILDLLIALFSGAAAAYAMARPSVANTIAGVAIATALVPPACSCGIALSYRQFPEFVGALFLLLANVVAIILAAAGTFRLMGLSAFVVSSKQQWVRYVVNGLAIAALLFTIPLGIIFMRQVREGKNAPVALSLTNEMRNVLLEHIDKKPGVEILFAGRAGIDRDKDPVDVAIILSSTHPLPRSEAVELIQLIRTELQNPDLQIRVECVVNGWVDEANEVN